MSDRIAILELASNLGIGGGARTVYNLCRFLDRDYFDVHGGGHQRGGHFEEELQKAGIQTIVSNGTAQPIIDYIGQQEIDVLHIHRSGFANDIEREIMHGARAVRPDIIIVEKNVFGGYSPDSRLIDIHLNISEMMMYERFLPQFKKDTQRNPRAVVGTLLNPVDAERFLEHACSEEEVAAYKAQLGIEPGDFVIGRFGRPHIAKWSDLILDAMPYLVKKIPNIKCIIQSLPEERKAYIASQPYAKHIIMEEQTISEKEIARFYQMLDVYTHTCKIGESFGMTLAEAGVFKRPVVVNSTPKKDNNQIVLIEHMKTGIIASHPKSFAEAIIYLYEHPEERQQMGEAGYAKISSAFHPKHIAGQLEAFIAQFMKLHLPDRIPAGLLEKHTNTKILDQKTLQGFPTQYALLLKNEFKAYGIGDVMADMRRAPRNMYFKVADYLRDR